MYTHNTYTHMHTNAHTHTHNTHTHIHTHTHTQGFALHVISTASECAVAGSFLLYFLTFHPDFTQIRVEVNVRLRKQHFYGTHINEKTPLTLWQASPELWWTLVSAMCDEIHLKPLHLLCYYMCDACIIRTLDHVLSSSFLCFLYIAVYTCDIYICLGIRQLPNRPVCFSRLK